MALIQLYGGPKSQKTPKPYWDFWAARIFDHWEFNGHSHFTRKIIPVEGVFDHGEFDECDHFTPKIIPGRGPNDILNASVSNGNYSDNVTLHPLYNEQSMSSISLANDAKKLKLDNAIQQQLTGILSVDMTKDFHLNSSLDCNADVSLNAEELSVVNNGSSMNDENCVVHIRNLCNDITDEELINLCLPFGKISNFLLLAQKGQAFIEFESKNSAKLLITVSQTSPIIFKNRTVVCQHSNHRQLKTVHINGNKIPTMCAVSSIQINFMGPMEQALAETVALPGINNGCDTTGILSSQTQNQPNSVLRVIIENMLYPVTLDILYQIFSRFGKVLRIITFTKNNTFQALIQFSDASSSQMAKTYRAYPYPSKHCKLAFTALGRLTFNSFSQLNYSSPFLLVTSQYFTVSTSDRPMGTFAHRPMLRSVADEAVIIC
uniref:RRM domain-containing protein n=1 Tax=Romanomermis culicivorax TaxID=13658 RepID=A0A915IM33_ROMCU